jgi:hypothetical protein
MIFRFRSSNFKFRISNDEYRMLKKFPNIGHQTTEIGKSPIF